MIPRGEPTGVGCIALIGVFIYSNEKKKKKKKEDAPE